MMKRHDCFNQTLSILSPPADTNSFPLGSKRMALILSVWKGTASESSVKETAEPARRSKMMIVGDGDGALVGVNSDEWRSDFDLFLNSESMLPLRN